MVHAAETREAARGALVDGWERARAAEPGKSRIILTHTNAEVRDLNELARGRLRAAGGLGDDVAVTAERGARAFATGDRIMFLKNERGMGVKNGTLGVLAVLTPERMAVRLDDGRAVAFDLKDYAHLDHGYAATIHKSQGVTVDRAHVLATPGLDRHGAYVALTRHRDGVEIHYGRDDFADQRNLVRTLSRERAKDMAGDYTVDEQARAQVVAFADRREIRLPEHLLSRAREVVVEVAAKAKGMFAGFRPSPAIGALVPAAPAAERPHGMFAGFAPQPVTRDVAVERGPLPLETAVARYARAVADIDRMRGVPVLSHQELARARAGEELDRVRPQAVQDLAAAFERDPALIGAAAGGRTAAAMRAIIVEGRMRADPALRAERFAGDWHAAQGERTALTRSGDVAGVARADQRIAAMQAGLARDPQMESLVRAKARQPGVTIPERERAAELARAMVIGRDRGRDFGR